MARGWARDAAVTTLPAIHAVTTDEVVARSDFLDRAGGVMRVLGARGALHLRSPTAGGQRLHEIAIALARLQERTGSWLVVNDRVDIALMAGARGIQLTSRSLLAADAARVIARCARSPTTAAEGPAIGMSVHSVDDARGAMVGDAVTWVVAGHVFASPSHIGEPARGKSFLEAVCAAVARPVIAIGGVRPVHIAALLAQGAYGAAAIRGIWATDDAERAAADYLSAYDAVRDVRADVGGNPDAHTVGRTGQAGRRAGD